MYLKERRIGLTNTNSLSIALYSFHLTGRCPPLFKTPKRKRKPSLNQKDGSSAAAPQENLRLSKTSSANKASALATPSISLDCRRTVKHSSTAFQPSGAIGYASATFSHRKDSTR